MNETVYSLCGEVFNYTDIGLFELGDIFYSGTKREIKPETILYTYADKIEEDLEEALYEEVGEVSVDAVSFPVEAKEKLNNLIKDFIAKNVTVNCYAVDNVKEHIMEDC